MYRSKEDIYGCIGTQILVFTTFLALHFATFFYNSDCISDKHKVLAWYYHFYY